MFENLEIGTIVTIGMGLITTFFGVYWLKFKAKIGQFVSLAVKVVSLISAFERAIGDEKITKEEISELKAAAEEIKKAFQALIGKK